MGAATTRIEEGPPACYTMGFSGPHPDADARVCWFGMAAPTRLKWWERQDRIDRSGQ